MLERAESMHALLDNAVHSVRRIISDLRPAILDDFGLIPAIKWQCTQFQQRTGIECQTACMDSDDNDCTEGLDKTLTINLFRIVQEALTNVARHSGASRVEIKLHRSDEEVVLSVCDNGRGLPQGHIVASTSHGMRGMSERVKQFDGKIQFDSPAGGGLCVLVTLPLPSGSKRQ
jgi:two-component system sensor histidine kinase UhpB